MLLAEECSVSKWTYGVPYWDRASARKGRTCVRTFTNFELYPILLLSSWLSFCLVPFILLFCGNSQGEDNDERKRNEKEAKKRKTVKQKSDKVSWDKMFQAINLNYYCKHLGFYVHSKHITVFSLLSWMEKMHAPSTSLSELWSLEIGNIKEANVTGGLWAVLAGLPACECPFITRLVQISRGSKSCTFPQYCRRPTRLPHYSSWLHGNCTPTKSPQNGRTGGPWQPR